MKDNHVPDIEVPLRGALEISQADATEVAKANGAIKLTAMEVSHIERLGMQVSGIGAYKTIAGEAVVSRVKLGEFLDRIYKSAEPTEGVNVPREDLLKMAPAIANLHGRLTDSIKLAKDIIAAENPAALPPTVNLTMPTAASSFPAGAIVGGNHVHVHNPTTS